MILCFQQCLTSSRSKTHENKFWGPNLGQNRARYFLKIGSLVFLEVEYNDSLRQFRTSSRGKTHEKKLGGPNMGQNRVQNN